MSKQPYLVFTLEGLKNTSSKNADLCEISDQFLYVTWFSHQRIDLAITFL